MSLHDKLAKKAVSMGKSSSEFKAAAQKHANATWFFVISALIVCYFWGWVWALIPIALTVYTALQSISSTMIATRIRNQEEVPQRSDTEFVHIVQAYGKVLETSAPTPGTVADVNKLPYPKQRIKDAIISALRSADDPKLKEHLKVAYIQLSDWQKGVGESNKGIDVTALDRNQDTDSLAKAILDQSSSSEKWVAIAQKEREDLKQELQEMGLW